MGGNSDNVPAGSRPRVSGAIPRWWALGSRRPPPRRVGKLLRNKMKPQDERT